MTTSPPPQPGRRPPTPAFAEVAAATAAVSDPAPAEPAADLPPPAPPEAIAEPGHVLQGISEIRAFFRKNETPIYFVSATAFNLLGIDRWVRNFTFVNWFDSFDGTHPNVFVPKERGYHEFESIEEIVNHLLGHKEVADLVEGRGGAGKACFLMFDDETEANLEALGLDLAFPSAALRTHLDSKIVTTQLGNEAGVPSVPNVLGQADGYDELLALASAGGLGSDLVVQTPYGDSGQTTFFVASAADWDATRGQDRRRADQGDAADRAARGGRGGRRDPARHAGRAGHDRARRVPRADALRGRLVRQRGRQRVLLRPPPRARAPLHAADGRPAPAGGLPRLLRARLPGRRGQRRAVPRRAEPARDGRELDDERDGGGVRRHAAVPVPPARVHGRRLRDRRRRS